MSKLDKKLSITHIRELSEKYSVTIEIKFGDNFRAIVENDNESHIIKNEFDVNLVEEITSLCKEMNKKGGKITLENVAGKELIEEATKHHQSFTYSNGDELKEADQELLEQYHNKAECSHKNVSSVGEFTNSENEKCFGFKIDSKLIFFDIQNNCMCVDEDGSIYEIGLYEI